MDVAKVSRKPRALIGKIGLDGHNRGAYVVAHGLSLQGVEVIYTGLRQTASIVARAAVQEDVDVIGISSMVGAHLSIIKKLRAELKKLGALDIPITIGGIIPREDYEALYALGVQRIFPTGTEVKEIAKYIFSLVAEKRWRPDIPGTLEGEGIDSLHLTGTACSACNRTFFPRRRNCPYCMDDAAVKNVKLPSKGRLQSFVVTKTAPPGYKPPHAQGYITLGENGPTLFSLLVDYNEKSLKAGMEMELKCVETGQSSDDEQIIGYRFAPAKGGAA